MQVTDTRATAVKIKKIRRKSVAAKLSSAKIVEGQSVVSEVDKRLGQRSYFFLQVGNSELCVKFGLESSGLWFGITEHHV